MDHLSATELIAIGGARGEPLLLRHRVMTAAGCYGDGAAFPHEAWYRRPAAIVTRTCATGRPRGAGRRRVAEAPAGLLYTDAVLSGGLESLVLHAGAAWHDMEVPLIVSIAAETAAGYSQLAAELAALPRVGGIEVRLWPDDARSDEGESPEQVGAAVRAAAAVTSLPLLVKLTPGPDIVRAAVAAAQAGADALVIAGGWPASAVAAAEPFRTLPRLDWRLAGPAVRPLTLRLVSRAAEETDLPIVGCGGVDSAAAVQAYLSAGACAVQVGSALLRDPFALEEIIAGLPSSLHAGAERLTTRLDP